MSMGLIVWLLGVGLVPGLEADTPGSAAVELDKMKDVLTHPDHSGNRIFGFRSRLKIDRKIVVVEGSGRRTVLLRIPMRLREYRPEDILSVIN
jgi:hypothetical protein